MPIDNATQTVDSVISLLTNLGVPIAAFGATAASALIAYFTYKFQKKSYNETADAEKERMHYTVEAEKERMRLAGLAEALRVLNDVKHREARKVLYHIDTHDHSSSSYDIIGIDQFDMNGESNHLALENICKEIVKNDCNEIGVLAYHGYLDVNKFVEEGFWVILKVWSLLEQEILQRRDRDSKHHMKHLQELRTKACEYAKKNDPRVYEEFCLKKAPTSAAPTNLSAKTVEKA